MSYFEIGKILYHKTNQTKSVIREVYSDYIIIELENEISGKRELKLPKTHIGEWLFYNKRDIELSIEKLAKMEEYSQGKRVRDYLELRRIEEMSIQLEIERQKRLIRKKNIELEKALNARNIINLVHFTRIENLDSILKKGFLPRELLDAQKIEYFNNDEERLDSRLDCTSFSIEFPNSFLLSRFRHKYQDSIYVVIQVDSSVY